MDKKYHIETYKQLLNNPELSKEQKELIRRELDFMQSPAATPAFSFEDKFPSLYALDDFLIFMGIDLHQYPSILSLQTLDELLARDEQRVKDGFKKRIRIGKLIKPDKSGKGKVIVVPTTYEPKFLHDPSSTEEEESTGGSGEGEEGEVIGEQSADPQPGEGEGEGAGEGQGGDHDIGADAFDLGKVLTEKFDLPNLKDKGKKRSFTKFTYDLTDRNRGFGQVLDKKATLKRVVQTNIQLGRLKPDDIKLDNLIISPQDHVFRILSKEKDFETQAVVFFMRDYSGSMQGKPTEVVTTQHLLIYSWLMFQYKNNVETRFIVHDTEAKEVPDFYDYHRYQVAGGTKVAPAFEMVNKIVEEEQLAKDYNIYVFYGTDGDDWDEKGEQLIAALRVMQSFVSRVGVTVAKNSWTSEAKVTNVERSLHNSNLLKEQSNLFRMDAFAAENASEERIITGIKRLIQ